MICVSGCTKNQGEATHPADKAIVDSQIPPGLAPQYFPPAGFVWNGFKSGNLPEARYSVASPSTNPASHVLIIADAVFPAEAYFGLARDFISLNYTVWIYEAPGQVGAGRYFLQGDHIHTPDYRHSVNSVQDLIITVIRPTTKQPVYILGTGTGALTALSIDADKANIGGIIVYSPYLSAPESASVAWRGEDIPSDEWARIGHKWQKANPDLRLRAVSKVWQTEMDKASRRLTNNSLKSLSFSREPPRRLVIANSETSSLSKVQLLCAGIKSCVQLEIS
ncbi:MAG: hypothetical protein B7Z26_08970, partial [Asticcacaulis sp. 32-58-5]